MIGSKVSKFVVRMCSTAAEDLRIANVLSDIPTKEHKIDVDGQTLHYIKVGKGPKHILCLPGMVGTIWSDFKPQIDRLDRSKFTVVAWDPPGYGESRPKDKQLDPDFYDVDATYAKKLMEVLGIPKYSLLGWSDGGVTGLFLAAKYPMNVEKMVVWGTGTYISPFEYKFIDSIKDLSTWSPEMLEPLIEIYTKQGLEDIMKRYSDALKMMYERGGDICSDLLQEIHCPTFILHGDKDPLLALHQPMNLLNNIKGSNAETREERNNDMEFKAHIAKLEGASNWTKWRRQIELLLRHHEVLEVTTGEIQSPGDPGDIATPEAIIQFNADLKRFKKLDALAQLI
ncbi:unnamed protein product [Phaedon cochleariae]|uniref:AB hydrolase-1 domain-containing protein n=1 Tax=Phaedon cochleariae TaxID=80249 RepID=A0A9N9SGB5_PHACE|nr:unnamed protein product [Phaedon cochleariae]